MSKEAMKLAREAGFNQINESVKEWNCFDDEIHRFAELVRADEREQCAKVAEDSDHVVGGRGYYDQLGDADATVRNVVAAIRARSNP